MGMLAVGRRRLFPWPSWFVTSDPCGLFCAFLTVCLMVFAHVVTVFLVLRGSQGLLSVHAILFTLCTVMGSRPMLPGACGRLTLWMLCSVDVALSSTVFRSRLCAETMRSRQSTGCSSG